MSRMRVRLPAVLTTGLVLLGAVVHVACERSVSPAVTATQPRPADSGEMTETETGEPPIAADGVPEQEQADVRPPREDTTDATAPGIEMDAPEKPEPKTPRYVSIVERIDSARHAKVHATIEAPRKLELSTENVKCLRLTREGLPLTRNLSIVLRIDGQGIEWTPRYVAVELERSSAGAWTVVRRRPAKP